MNSELKQHYILAAQTWLTNIDICDMFILKSNDKEWWEVRKKQCKVNYDFCMLRATEPENNAKEINKKEFLIKFGNLTIQDLINQQN